MTEPAFDLDAYCARIGYGGVREPTLAVLNSIVAAHVAHIPFENLDVLLGRTIALDAASLERKLVRGGRGGYCFEQNGLLLHVLEIMGYAVTPISARVRWQRAREVTPPRTHLFIRVEIEEQSWLADVGVGAVSPTAAIRLILNTEQTTPHEPRRIVKEDARYFHQIKIANKWQDVCEFTLEAMPPIDRELANWYTSAHPQSHFKNRLLAARAASNGGRVTLLNDEFVIRDANGHAHKQILHTPQALLEVLAEHFALHFDAATRFGPPGSPWPV